MINATEERITNVSAATGLTTPFGISLTAVREFCASMFLSMYLLNAIAAVLAKIMQRITLNKSSNSKCDSGRVMAIVKPIKAKGIAKTV